MYSPIPDPLNDLLGTAISALDITRQEFERAQSRYRDVANALADYWDEDPIDCAVYPQGSMRLGTVTRKIHRNDEFDVDLVAERKQSKHSITQVGLKVDVGQGLEKFLAGSPEGDPDLEDGKRCWTLAYPGFHIDTLPALPDRDARSTTGIIITDRDLHEWQYSDPIGYADWFYDRMQEEWQEKATVLSKRTDIEPVPDWLIKTTLQQTVQALKRHRDIYFTGHLEDRPASIILTTLAARAYRGGGALYEVLDDITDRLPTFVRRESGIYVVSNPVQERENFADRWKEHPERAEYFFEWAERARADFADLGADRGIDTVLTKMSAAFGAGPSWAAARASANRITTPRRRSELGFMPTTGMLAPAYSTAARPIKRDHNFHGDSPLGPA